MLKVNLGVTVGSAWTLRRSMAYIIVESLNESHLD